VNPGLTSTNSRGLRHYPVHQMMNLQEILSAGTNSGTSWSSSYSGESTGPINPGPGVSSFINCPDFRLNQRCRKTECRYLHLNAASAGLRKETLTSSDEDSESRVQEQRLNLDLDMGKKKESGNRNMLLEVDEDCEVAVPGPSRVLGFFGGENRTSGRPSAPSQAVGPSLRRPTTTTRRITDDSSSSSDSEFEIAEEEDYPIGQEDRERLDMMDGMLLNFHNFLREEDHKERDSTPSPHAPRRNALNSRPPTATAPKTECTIH